MAQAAIHLIKSDCPSASPSAPEMPPASWNQRTRDAWSSAFFDMEEGIDDLVQMARIARGKVHDAVGNLTLEDGVVIDGGQITDDQICAAQFAVSHLVKMIEAMQADYFAAYRAG